MMNQVEATKEYHRGFRDGKNSKPKKENASEFYQLGYKEGDEFRESVIAKLKAAYPTT